MSGELQVHLGGEPIARLESTGAGTSLIYDVEWQERQERIPLSLALPAVKQRHRSPAVDYFFDALLPDDPAVRTRWGRDWGVDASDTYALLSVVGEDLSGAVQVVPSDRSPSRRGPTEWLSEAELAALLRALRADSTSWIADTDLGAFSLAGAQRKTALIHENGRWGRARGPTVSTHILKTGVSGLESQAEVEHLSLRLAHHLGFPVARSTLLQVEDQVALVVERFDRVRINGRIHRLHQEDGCQALGRDPRKRYHAEGGPRAAELVRLLWQNTVAPRVNAESFASALLLQWLIGGTDAHARNYSVQHLASGTRLAPLYDIASVLPYLPPDRAPRLAMAIGGETQVDQIGPPALATEAKACGLPSGWMLERALALLDALPRAIDQTATEATALPGTTAMLERWADSLREYHAKRREQLTRRPRRR